MTKKLKPGELYKADELPEKIKIEVSGLRWSLGYIGASKCLFLELGENQVIAVGMNANRAEREDIYQYVLDATKKFRGS